MVGIDRGMVSGIAPRAHVVAYKGLGNLGGFGSDLAAAIDQAVADGVDVINYSVGGGPSLTGEDDIAYLFAANAGVFVATSAGNSGPAPYTIGGPASVPWLISVGASTQERSFQGSAGIQAMAGSSSAPRSPTAQTSFRSSTPPTLATSSATRRSLASPTTSPTRSCSASAGRSWSVWPRAKRCMESGGAGTILYNVIFGHAVAGDGQPLDASRPHQQHRRPRDQGLHRRR